MTDQSFSIHLPASLAADSSKLKEKTLKIGWVGRILGIFRVEEVFIYGDDDPKVDDSEKEVSTIISLLEYMDTPQYLRKIIFPYREELQYVGILPPLRTPHHPLQDERREKGSIREAAVIESNGGESKLEIGLPEEGVFKGDLEEGERVTVRLGEKINRDKRLVDIVDRTEVGDYWGFSVFKTPDIAQSLSKSREDYTIGTSRLGQNLYEAIKGIKANNIDAVTIAFGGPYQGLFEICERQGVDTDDLFDIIVNAIPKQGTATVRTEEALNTTLGALNILLRRK